MNRLYMLFLATFLSFTVVCQTSSDFPEGVYYTQQEFINKKPENDLKIRKLNILLPTHQAFLDTIVDHCWFLDSKNDPIKKAFAVVHKGELYFPEYSIKRYMPEEYSTMGMTKALEFHRVQDWGRYLYFEVTYSESDPGMAIAMGAMFGMIGGALGAALTDKTLVETPVIYDTKKGRFYGLHTRSQLKLFMDTYYPDNEFDIKAKDMDMETVRTLINDLNSRERTSN